MSVPSYELFESMSGLKVNINKSLPIGVDLRRLGFWDPVNGAGGYWWIEVVCGLECWKLLVGLEKGRVTEGGRGGSSWWREIVRIWDGDRGVRGGWFGESVSKKVGDGSDTFFWTDRWWEFFMCEI
ncbi:cysteine-rich receptor-like protein kinase [Trifolium medium]|uniref:Cysteine-rich receptor-like protein kinase n=1 Tax=Trifolium medium TaxID=97028 RepID=A0A392MEC3_9FABA|nr:cysteine-rich receptor-like protein kinase [Trifolium medium]